MVPRSLALLRVRAFFVFLHIRVFLGVVVVDAISLILVIVGSVMVYGAKLVLRLFKQEVNDNKILIVKAIGLGISLIGFLKIFEVF